MMSIIVLFFVNTGFITYWNLVSLMMHTTPYYYTDTVYIYIYIYIIGSTDTNDSDDTAYI